MAHESSPTAFRLGDEIEYQLGAVWVRGTIHRIDMTDPELPFRVVPIGGDPENNFAWRGTDRVRPVTSGAALPLHVRLAIRLIRRTLDDWDIGMVGGPTMHSQVTAILDELERVTGTPPLPEPVENEMSPEVAAIATAADDQPF